MKHLKTKLGLSVLALACLGAGVISLQPTASAEEVWTAEAGLVMTNGAMVRISPEGAEFTYNGIRWETTVKAGHYDDVAVLGYGAIVAPTQKLVADGKELTHDNVDYEMDLPVVDGFSMVGATEDKTFYSVINYNKLAKQLAGGEDAQAKLEQAYEMELTARAYVKIKEEGVEKYYYADLTNINTSRSARQVAIAAALDEKTEATVKADTYQYYGEKYGMEKYFELGENDEKSTGAVGTAVVDLAAEGEQTVVINNFAIADNIEEVLIGAEKVEVVNYAEQTLTIKITKTELKSAPEAGEKYVTVFTDKGICTKPVIYATKVIKNANDLSIFNAKGNDGTNTTKHTQDGVDLTGNWDPEQEDSGYYVLGGNINAEGYVHGSKNEDGSWNDSTWNGAASYAGKPIGLTGTFNGMGYAITDLEIGNEREGIFGIVNGGTVKNVAITDVKAEGEYKFVLANTLCNATIENVYIKTEAYEEGVSKGFPMLRCTAFASLAAKDTQISSCLIHFATTNTTGTKVAERSPTGVMFLEYGSDFNAKDVYCVSDNLIGSYTHTLMYLSSLSENENYTKNKKVWLAENEAEFTSIVPDLSSTDETTGKPTVAPKDNNTKDANYVADLGIKLHSDAGRPRVVMEGAFRYNSLAILYKYNTTYKNLANTGCWYLNDNNELVWGQNPNA